MARYEGARRRNSTSPELKAEVQNRLEEINLGTEDDSRPTFISSLLDQSIREELIALLQELKDCFSWHYHEMPSKRIGRTQVAPSKRDTNHLNN